jgi:hypothetical protein
MRRADPGWTQAFYFFHAANRIARDGFLDGIGFHFEPPAGEKAFQFTTRILP